MPPQSSEHGFYPPTQRAEPMCHPRGERVFELFFFFLAGDILYETLTLILDMWRLEIQSANIHTDAPGRQVIQCETVANDLGTLNMAR